MRGGHLVIIFIFLKPLKADNDEMNCACVFLDLYKLVVVKFVQFHVGGKAIMSFSLCIKSTRKELRTKEMNQDNIIRLGYPMQPKSIDPTQVVQLSWHPRVFLYRDFLSEEECDYLISWVREKKSYNVSDDDSPKIETNNIPANFGVSMDADDEIAKSIEERISGWTFLPKENSKSMSILHFGPENSKQNYNYFHNESAEQVGLPLLATNEMLTDCTKTSNIFRPSKGNAIVFFNLHLNATLDGSSLHARCPVLEGDMWCATKLFYLKDISTERDSDDADCTDEDENCSRWAAIGECQRNSIFMIGSPDYYGTCRKSCNAC
ncbi:hypothetical protein DH2020_048638 [Rehmannia glutinosa]|uniref:procollagen-proline 4-dioxygenase n=1 Tax=Rehmannia glutinosa TaxID=99300 RepID=A0ABR0U530_REHGL